MSRQWYPFYVGDYNKKTAHLSLLEHGAYRLLIDHYMATASPLPNDMTILCRICRANNPTERRAVTKIASEFFENHGAVLVSDKCDHELLKQLNFSNSQSAKAKLRHSPGTAQLQPTTTTTTKKESKNSNRGTRFALAQCPDEWVDFCKNLRPDINPLLTFDAFKDYWSAVAGAKGVKLDWFATWRNWIRNQKHENNARINGIDNKPSKTERAYAAARRAAGVDASGGFGFKEKTGGHAYPMLPDPKNIR